MKKEKIKERLITKEELEALKAQDKTVRENLKDIRAFLEFIKKATKRGFFSEAWRFVKGDFSEFRRQSIVERIDQACASEHLIPLDFSRLTCETVIKSFQSDFLVRKLLEYGDKNVSTGMLFSALILERQHKKKKKFFTDEQKRALIDLFLCRTENKEDSKASNLYYGIKMLLYNAEALPHNEQLRLLNKYLEIQHLFAPASNLFDGFVSWQGLAPDLRQELFRMIYEILSNTILKPSPYQQKAGIEIQDMSNKMNVPSSDPDNFN